jgi:hypothetical protein
MLAAEINWQGLPDHDGQIPRCRGRAEALERMRIGLLANSEVSVSAFVEEGDRVIAHVHRVGDDDELGPPERFLVAEVHNAAITKLRGYATEAEAEEALHAGSPPDGSPDSDLRPHATREAS